MLDRVGYAVGRLAGTALAPVAAAGGALRRARLFHPVGTVWRAEVEPVGTGELGPVAARLAGPALARLSGATWKRPTGPDLVGLALRFGGSEGGALQDLVLASFRHLPTLPLDALRTRWDDYLANAYWSVTPYEVEGLGKVRFRARGVGQSGPGADREERLARSVADDQARIEVAVRRDGEWQPLVVVRLTGPADVSGEALRFSPHHAELGIRPVGFVNGLRRRVYPAGQAGRRAVRPR